MIVSILIYGLVNSVILILTALGFSLTLGLSRVANFAHGGIYIFSGLVAWLLLKRVGLPYPIALLLAVLTSGLFGALIYRLILIRVRGIELSEVIATFAVGVAILELFRWLGFVTYEFILPLTSVIVGGQGSFAGALLGALLLVPVSESLRAFGTLRVVLYSIILVIFTVGLPEGIFPYIRRRYHQFEARCRWRKAREHQSCLDGVPSDQTVRWGARRVRLEF